MSQRGRFAVTLAHLPTMAGAELGVTAWRAVGPHAVADAHYSVLALLGGLWPELLDVTDAVVAVNYGLDSVRFEAKAEPGSRVRLRARIRSTTPIESGTRLVVEQVIELDGSPQPALVAVSLYDFRGAALGPVAW